MPSLSEIQDHFAKATLDADAVVPQSVKSHLRKQPAKRFNVYRNNIYSTLIDVLQARFATVARLVGEEFFRATARVFVEEQPPTSPVLMRYGGTFGDFLDAFEPAAGLPYLGDIARLEWAWSQAYHAADATPLGPDDLTRIPPEQVAGLSVTLHPSVHVVRSAYPIVTILAAHGEEDDPEEINLGAGAEDALVIRPALSVEVRKLPPGGAVFIESLATGATLEAAAQAALDGGPFDLQVNLTGLFGSGAVCALGHDEANGPARAV